MPNGASRTSKRIVVHEDERIGPPLLRSESLERDR
jgi:hypothetical protein